MSQAKAVILDAATIDCGDIDMSLFNQTPYEWSIHQATRHDEASERLREAEVVVSNKVVLDRTLLTQADRLKLICVAATGTNNVDLEAAGELGVAVTNVAGYSTPSVVQWVFTHILALTCRLPEHHQAVCQGEWQRSPRFALLDYPFRELAGKTLGIVGYGVLGQAVARVAEAFGMQLLIARRPGGEAQTGRVPLDKLLPQVDVLSLHCPLTENTRNLIGRDELAAMKPDALLINAARGGIVDEEALAKALAGGTIGGAGVDVLSCEPPTAGNPLLEQPLPNLILSPHVAWASRESRQRLVMELVANIQAFVSGERRNRLV